MSLGTPMLQQKERCCEIVPEMEGSDSSLRESSGSHEVDEDRRPDEEPQLTLKLQGATPGFYRLERVVEQAGDFTKRSKRGQQSPTERRTGLHPKQGPKAGGTIKPTAVSNTQNAAAKERVDNKLGRATGRSILSHPEHSCVS